MNRRSLLVRIIAALSCVALLAGCSPYTASHASVAVAAAAPKTASTKQATGSLANTVNAFGFDLLGTGGAGDSSSNVIVSPLSVAAALAMTANGAQGETLHEMRATLHETSSSPSEENSSWAALLAALGNRSRDQQLSVANSLWGDKRVTFRAPFLADDRDYFGAQITTLDFKSPAAPEAINGWVSKNTHGMIRKIVTSIPDEAILYLVNAVYFKGTWTEQFTASATQNQPFTLADGSSVPVPMMHDTRALHYAETSAYQAVALPYQGGDSTMYVVLPKPGVSLASVVQTLSAAGFSALKTSVEGTGSSQVELGLPKLDSSYSTHLAETLKQLGMSRAFDPERAQFHAMSDLPVPIWIGDVLHKTRVKIDEKGTEAAAVTAVTMYAGAVARPAAPPVRMVVDHPYLIALADNKSGALLFLGEINDPRR